MQIAFDPAKNEANRAKHGVELTAAKGLEWDTAVTWLDTREDYGEDRKCAIGYIGLRLYFVAFVEREDYEGTTRRIISLRKANKREENIYAQA